MARLTDNQYFLLKAIAENKDINEIRDQAKICCEEVANSKYDYQVKHLLNCLSTRILPQVKVPFHLQNMLETDSIENFRDDRFYLSSRESKILDSILSCEKVSNKMRELGIRFLNSTLLVGESGVGKTMFVKYLAKKLDLPFIYVNFSYLIDCKLGQTSSNLRDVFRYANSNKCVLMLDEIDCIATTRKGGDGPDREFSNITITLLQELDKLNGDVIVVAATNVENIIDKAVKRRFVNIHRVEYLSSNENEQLIKQYLSTLDNILKLDDKTISKIANDFTGKSQSSLINKLNELLVEKLNNDFKEGN